MTGSENPSSRKAYVDVENRCMRIIGLFCVLYQAGFGQQPRVFNASLICSPRKVPGWGGVAVHPRSRQAITASWEGKRSLRSFPKPRCHICLASNPFKQNSQARESCRPCMCHLWFPETSWDRGSRICVMGSLLMAPECSPHLPCPPRAVCPLTFASDPVCSR